MNENPEEWLAPFEVLKYIIVENFYIPTGNVRYHGKGKHSRWWWRNWGKGSLDDGIWVPITDETEELMDKISKIKNRDREIIERFPNSIVPYWHELK